MLRPFEVLEPSTIAEASGELRRLGDSAKFYAGGVELLLLLRHGLVDADYLVNIKQIPGLNGIRWDGQAVRLGTTVTHRRMEWDELLRERLPLLADAEKHVGNIRVRTQGTLGGNLCFADPHADPATPLLIYDASVVVQGGAAVRELPLEEFLVGSYTVALKPDELLTEVVASPLPAGWSTAYERVEQFYRPTLNVAAAVKRSDGHLEGIRLAVGCIGPRTVRLRELESKLRGAPLKEAPRIVDDAAGSLEDALQPIGDLLGSAEYKLYMTRTLLKQTIDHAAKGAAHA